ncbi:DUF2279 domain-containing protein [soil metagenome]
MLLLHLHAGAQHLPQDSISFFTPSPVYNPAKANGLAIGMTTAYVGGMSILYGVWYKDYPTQAFHLFDDSKEWLQMDKLGHTGSAYYLSRWSAGMVRWTGTEQKKAAWIGTGIGYGFQLTVEVMDGFSSEWGFSTTDILANTVGAGLFLSQELGWKEQRIAFKMSYHQSDFAKYRPNVLGSSFSERVLKDYNGQTYWLSANIKSFLHRESKFPAWLNFAVGYGADGMVGAEDNNVETEGTPPADLKRYRQYYLSADIDLTRIKTRSPLLKTVFEVFGFIKIPAPTIEYNSKGNFVFHPFYF